MQVHVDPSGSATVVFESDEELRAEYEANLAAGGIRLSTDVQVPLFSEIAMTLRLEGGGQFEMKGTVVNDLGGALAVAFEAAPETLLEALTRPEETDGGGDEGDAEDPERSPGLWERIRSMTRTEKLLLAPKATRGERVILLKENDAQVLYSLLKNPRITTDEVGRIARSYLLTAQTADLIAKTTQWASRADIRCALVANPRTPPPLALKLLPTLPEAEIRRIAKATAVSQALRQAALRLVIDRR